MFTDCSAMGCRWPVHRRLLGWGAPGVLGKAHRPPMDCGGAHFLSPDSRPPLPDHGNPLPCADSRVSEPNPGFHVHVHMSALLEREEGRSQTCSQHSRRQAFCTREVTELEISERAGSPLSWEDPFVSTSSNDRHDRSQIHV